VTVPGPHPGGHHAKLVCGACGRWLRWLPRPRPQTSAEGFRRGSGLAPPDGRLPPLAGTDRQVAYALTVRAGMLRRLRDALSPDAYRALRGIADAPWWLANRDRPAEALRWPATWFEPAEFSGSKGGGNSVDPGGRP
jgi:hypothetical protein